MPYNPRFTPKKMQGFFCSSPWNTVTVEADGSVYSCQCSNWTNYPIGNLLTHSLTEICSKSAVLESIKETVLNGTYSWCSEGDCNELTRLPRCKTDDPFTEFNVDPSSALPINLTLAIDYNCNLRCASCRNEKFFETRIDPNVEYMLDNLSNAYKDFDKQVLVMLDGGGDVFVSRAYQNFLFTDKLPRCWKLMILTNGNLLTKKHDEIQKIANQIDLVTVSLDAATPKTYAITRGGNWDIVMNGIQMLKEMNIAVHLQFVLQRANYAELLEYKKIANSFNVGYGVQKIDFREHMSAEYWKNVTLEDNPAIDYAMLRDHLTVLNNDPRCNLDGGTRWLLARL